jgi:hypothetical protein
VEVAQVGDRGCVLGGPARVGEGAGVAIGPGGVERDELDVGRACVLEGELGAAQDVASRRAGRPAERQAGVDP